MWRLSRKYPAMWLFSWCWQWLDFSQTAVVVQHENRIHQNYLPGQRFSISTLSRHGLYMKETTSSDKMLLQRFLDADRGGKSSVCWRHTVWWFIVCQLEWPWEVLDLVQHHSGCVWEGVPGWDGHLTIWHPPWGWAPFNLLKGQVGQEGRGGGVFLLAWLSSS